MTDTSTIETSITKQPEMSSAAVVHAIAAALLLVFPFLASNFFTFQIGAYALILGTIALSLMFLGGYGGMVSLTQMSVAGLAGYMVAIYGTNSIGGLGWPWFLTIIAALVVGVLFSVVCGLLAIRTAGIYTIMITLAIAMALYYFTQQNYDIFNGHSGLSGVAPVPVLGVDWRAPKPFYFLSLAVAASSYAAVLYISRSPFGLSLQAIRDNARRMEAIGFNVTAHRVAAYALAGLIASLAGILLVWFDGRISPGTISADRVIKILVIAVVGGLSHPIGPYLGAILFVLLQNFAIDLISPERFNTFIGLTFLVIVLASPDGMLGLFRKLAQSSATSPSHDKQHP
jgi:branched-chain amino acid transport system permease protein